MSDELSTRYTAALERHLGDPGEESLASAYALGRELLTRGEALIALAQAHRCALVELAARQPLDRDRLDAAQAFFNEALGVFEMAHRGYREANQGLRARNAELEAAKESVEATSRELEAFSYSVSHDLRAPLRAIDGFGQALEEDNAAQLDETGKRHLKRVRDATRQMSQLIDDLLRLARISRGELVRQSVDLGALARAAFDRLRKAEPARKVELSVAEPVVARADPRLLAVAMENLVSNAWKFTSKKPQARIEVGRVPDSRTYFVRDDGAGFDMRYVDRLFGAFQRLHSQAEFEGTGVGLATVQRIVRRHGGRIWAQGTVGQGATFSFTLGE